MTKVPTYRVETSCEECPFELRVRGCATPEEAINIGQAAARLHNDRQHPDHSAALTFKVYDVNGAMDRSKIN